MKNQDSLQSARVHLVIFGRVQGVFFRSHAKKYAEKLNLTGWIRNLPDGRVEVLFEGDKSALEEIICWCRKGPPYAVIGSVEISWQDYTGEFRAFVIK